MPADAPKPLRNWREIAHDAAMERNQQRLDRLLLELLEALEQQITSPEPEITIPDHTRWIN